MSGSTSPVTITHAFTSGKAQGADSTRVYGAQWDQNHLVPIATGAQAQAGTDSSTLMTPQLVASAIAAQILPAVTPVTDKNLARFDGTAGRIQNSSVNLDNSNNMTFPNGAWIKGYDSAGTTALNMFRLNSSNYTEWSNVLYFDGTGHFTNRSAALSIEKSFSTPTGVPPNLTSIVSTIGNDNGSTVRGVSAGYFLTGDNSTVTSTTKGALYGTQFVVSPIVDRNNSPYDDAVAAQFQNGGTAKATEIAYFGRNSSISGSEATAVIGIDTYADDAIYFTGHYDIGLDFLHGGGAGATITTGWALVPNAAKLLSKNASATANITLIRADSTNKVLLANDLVSINSTTGGLAAPSLTTTSAAITVPSGGTGNGTFTANGILLGNGNSALNVSSAMTDGQLLVGQSGSAPLPKTISGDVTINAAGSTSISGQVALSKGGTNADLSATGGTSQVLKQISAGAAITVAQLATSDLSDVTSWSNWTPTFTAGAGAFTSINAQYARYFKIGKLIAFNLEVHVTTNGTASTSLNFTLPTTASTSGVCFGFETLNGDVGYGTITGASSTCVYKRHAGVFPGADGAFIPITGTYETQ